MRIRVGLIVLTVVAATLVGCVPARAGARCRTTEWGDDGTYALKCERGKWVRKATKAQVAQLLIALARSRQATTTSAPPATVAATTTTIPAPTTIVPAPIVPTQISANYESACARMSNATVKCWGSNNNSQVTGDGTTSATVGVAPTTVAGLADATAVTAGYSNSCAIVTGGRVKCWGRNNVGQLGDNTTTPRSAPVTVVDAVNQPITGVTQVAIGATTSCALLSTGGSVVCWGDGSSGQIASGGSFNSDSASAVLTAPATPLTNATSITSFNQHSCVILADTTAYCWGLDGNGQIGNNSLAPPTSALYAVGVNDNSGGATRTGFVSIAAGDYHTCGVTSDGVVRCWGLGVDGALGHGTDFGDLNYPSVASPVLSSSTTQLGSALSVTAGSFHSCAVLSVGEIRCWGANNSGQRGIGTIASGPPTAAYADTPVTLAGGSVNVPAVSIAAGSAFECFLSASHEVRCGGSNSRRQLGNSTSSIEPNPVLVAL